MTAYTSEQIENLPDQVGIAMNVLDALHHGRDIIARLGVELDIIDVDLAQQEDLVFGNSHGGSPKSMANRGDRPQTPGRGPILRSTELTQLAVLKSLNQFGCGH